MSVLAIDHGVNKCGIAQEIAGVALPLSTVPTRELDEYLQKIIPSKGVGTIVIGLAKHLDGRDSPQSRLQQKFAREITSHFPECKIVLWDERLTTSEARLSLDEA